MSKLMEKGKKNLASSDLLSDLNKTQFDQLLTICHPLEVPAGKVIMKEGETGDSMFLFAAGVVDVT
jgi:hypothetical protein